MAQSAQDIANLAVEKIDELGGLTAFIRDWGIGGVWAAFFLNLIDTVRSFGTLILGPPRALGRGAIALIDAVFDGLIGVFDASTAATVESFATGLASLLGPFAQPAGVGVIMLSFTVFLISLDRLELNPILFITDRFPGG